MSSGLPKFTTPSVIAYKPKLIAFEDDFKNTLLRWRSTSGTVERITTYGYHGACLHLQTAASMDAEAAANVTFSLKEEKTLELLIDFWLPYQTYMRSCFFSLNYYDGENIRAAGVEWFKDATKWKYQTGVGATPTYTDVPDGEQVLYSHTDLTQQFWHRLSLIIDLVNSKYVKLSCQGKIMPLTDLDLYVLPYTTVFSNLVFDVHNLNASNYSEMMIGYVRVSEYPL